MKLRDFLLKQGFDGALKPTLDELLPFWEEQVKKWNALLVFAKMANGNNSTTRITLTSLGVCGTDQEVACHFMTIPAALLGETPTMVKVYDSNCFIFSGICNLDRTVEFKEGVFSLHIPSKIWDSRQATWTLAEEDCGTTMVFGGKVHYTDGSSETLTSLT